VGKECISIPHIKQNSIVLPFYHFFMGNFEIIYSTVGENEKNRVEFIVVERIFVISISYKTFL